MTSPANSGFAGNILNMMPEMLSGSPSPSATANTSPKSGIRASSEK